MIHRYFWALAFFFIACGDKSAPLPRLEQGRFILQAQNGSLTLLRDGVILAEIPADGFQVGVVRQREPMATYDPYWLEVDGPFKPEPPATLRFWKVVDQTLSLDDGRFVVQQTFEGNATGTLTITPANDRFYCQWRPVSSSPIVYHRIQLAADDLGFYGLGQSFDSLNQLGRQRPMQMEADLSIESANNEQHVPVPLLLGIDGWGLFVASRQLGLFDVAHKTAGIIEVTYGNAAEQEGLDFYLFAADHPLDLTHHYYQITGNPLLPARWAYGPWIWRDENRDQAEVLDDIAQIRALDLPTSGLWIDRPYATAVNTFDFNSEKFPAPDQLVQRAHAAGLRLALWHTPYLEAAAQPLEAEAKSRGFFPPQVGLKLNGWSEPLDLSNPEAYAWWQGLIRRYTQLGFEGFKLDYAEDLLPGLSGGRAPWRFFDGSSELTMHHDYTILYHKVYAETLPASGGFLLGRAGRWGDQVNVSVIWPGDLDADLSRHKDRVTKDGDAYVAVGGLPASVVIGASLGPSGFPFFGADTGGYRHSPPNKETFIRWFQQTALSTVMQVGDSSSQPPWVFTKENGRDTETLDLYRQFARLHLRLFPYVWTYAEQLAETGRAIQRPLGLAHPELGQHPDDVYLLGDHLLVAPVVEAGATTRSLTLPPGAWYDWFTQEKYPGGPVTVAAPLEKLPLWIRAGGLVPMLGPTVDTLAPASDPGVESYVQTPGLLWVRVAPPQDTLNYSFQLFDGTVVEQKLDNGLSLATTAGDEFSAGVIFEVIGTYQRIEIAGQPASAAASLDALVQDGGYWVENGLTYLKLGPQATATLSP